MKNLIENYNTSDILFENYDEVEIKINSTYDINNKGVLEIDSLNNNIGSAIYSGTNTIFACTNYNTTGSLLLYTEKQWCLINGTFNIEDRNVNNIINSIVIQQNQPINYKVSAGITSTSRFNGNTGTLNKNLTGLVVFKVYLNGEEVTDYTIDGNLISFNSNYKEYGNYAEVIYYDSNQNILKDITLKYYNTYKTAYLKYSDFIEGVKITGDKINGNNGSNIIYGTNTRFLNDCKIGQIIRIDNEIKRIRNIVSNTEIVLDNVLQYDHINTSDFSIITNIVLDGVKDFSVNPNYTYDTFETTFAKQSIKTKTGQAGTLSFSYYINEGTPDLLGINYATTNLKRLINTKNKFRISEVSKVNGLNKITYYTNCRLTDGVQYSRGNDINKDSVTIDFEDKITLLVNDKANFGATHSLTSYTTNTGVILTSTPNIISNANTNWNILDSVYVKELDQIRTIVIDNGTSVTVGMDIGNQYLRNINTNGTTTITGVNTKFTDLLSVNDYIIINNTFRKITEVNSNTQIKVNGTVPTGSNQNMRVIKDIPFFISSNQSNLTITSIKKFDYDEVDNFGNTNFGGYSIITE